MPDSATRRQYRMDTKVFCLLWAKNLQSKSDYQSFCVNLFERFTDDNLTREKNPWIFEDKWDGIEKDTDMQFVFMSDRVYAKCQKIRNDQVKAGFEKPEMPKDYESRNGIKQSVRFTPKDISVIFSKG